MRVLNQKNTWRSWRLGGSILILILLAACRGDPNAEATLRAENALLNTQIVELRATATHEIDRLRITAEYIQTAITRVALENQQLAATLVSLGLSPAEIAAVQPGVVIVPTQPPGIAAPPVTQQAVTPGTPAAPGTIITATPTPAPPTLYNAVMAEGVGDNDCALAAMTSFSSSDERIYVVATAANITPGMTLRARWYQEGVEVAVHDFAPDFAIDQNCVWFFADQTDFSFTPGSYSVQLEIDGVPQGQPAGFTVAG